ncbi:MAG: ELWxxDGT repeat protein [Chitinophagaceae bacterium]
MKLKFLLLSCVLLLFISFYGIAQKSPVIPHSVKDIIPFGKKLPLQVPVNYSDKHSLLIELQNKRAELQRNLVRSGTANKDPKYYQEQLARFRQSQILSFNSYRPSGQKDQNRPGRRSDFHLTRDINALAEGNPSNNLDVFPYTAPYAILNGNIYFSADDGIHGTELWKSDGTPKGTLMVKDLEPGEASTYITNITAVNGKIYFAAAASSYGLEPWVSDGTEVGTFLLKDIKPGWSYPTEFVGIGNTVYFVTDGDFSFYGSLWKTNGTPEGTVLVRNLGDTGDGGAGIFQTVAANGLLFFSFYSFASGGSELWRSDGSDAGTFHIGPPASFPVQLTNFNNLLYFSQNDGTGYKLWTSDGTEAGTKYASNNNDILIDNDYPGVSFPVMNNVLYAAAHTESSGSGLYKYDPSGGAGLVLVKDLTAGTDPDFISPSEMKIVNNRLYFKVSNQEGGLHEELWSSNGTAGSTRLVKKFEKDETIGNLYNGNGILYFVKSDPVVGTELWKANIIAPGVSLVSDIFKGTASSFPKHLTSFKGRLFFSAADERKGTELFSTFGYDLFTFIVKDLNTASTSTANIANVTALGDDVIFTAYERVHGTELYKSDGTNSGTDLLYDLQPLENGIQPSRLLARNNAVYFTLELTGPKTFSSAIYKTTVNKGSLKKVAPVMDNTETFISNFDVADNGLVFFVKFNFWTGARQLWRSDGSPAGTFLLSSTLYFAEFLNVVGNKAYFVAGDEINGYELWKSDGSIAGTSIVKDINPGLADAAPGGLFDFNNEVYFGAYDGASADYSLWKSDGTKDGTIKLKDIDPTWGYDVASTGDYFCVLNNVLYFNANDHAEQGVELWRTNGTPQGTQLVKDIYPGAGSSYPARLKTANGILFFNADDGEHGFELWKSNGQEKGTQLVKDLTPGPDAGYVSSLADAGGKLIFTLSTYTGYAGLWVSDGTANGTVEIPKKVTGDIQILGIVPAGNRVFFIGNNYKYGTELYSGWIEVAKPVNESARPVTKNIAETIPSFIANLYPNPATSNTTLQISADARKNVSITMTDINGKNLWQSNGIGKGLVTLPTEKLRPGLYIVTIKTGNDTKTIKLVKQ